MTPEILAVWADEALLSDQLRIIAGERNALPKKDREALVSAATLIEDMIQRYQAMRDTIVEANGRLIAQSERLAALQPKVPLEARIGGKIDPAYVRFGSWA